MALKFINTFEIEPTNHCNAKCIFCPREVITRPKGYMSWEVFTAIISKAVELNVTAMTFAGFGEPFLHKELLKQLAYMETNAPQIANKIISNGSLITPNIADELKSANLAELVISFNGYDKASYEQNMTHLSFDRIIANLKHITKKAEALRAKIRFIPVLTKTFNLPEYSKMKELLFDLGFKAENFPGYYPCINRAGYFKNPEVADASTSPAQPMPEQTTDNLMCTRFLSFLQIVWNGDIRLCYNDINNEAILGNILTSTNEEVEKMIVYFRNPKTKPAICRRCDDPILRGGFQFI